MLKDMGCSDEVIIEKLVDVYKLDIMEAKRFLNE